MSEKENKYNYFISYVVTMPTSARNLYANSFIDLDSEVMGQAQIDEMEKRVMNHIDRRLNGTMKVSAVTILNFSLVGVSGGESPALPTDEEIRREAHKKANESPQDRIPNGRELAEWGMAGFVDGAKWMRDQISQEL